MTRKPWPVGWSLASAVVLLLVTTPATAQVPEAILLMDGEAAQSGSGRVAEVVRAQMMRIYRVVSGPEAVALARREPACEGQDLLGTLLQKVRDGSDLFFERTDLEGASRVLDGAVALFFERPCLARGEEAALRAMCAGATLLVRLHLLRGQTREAEGLARLVARVFPARMVEETQEPPEVLALVAGARAHGREIEVTVSPAERVAGAMLLVNGTPANGEAPWRVRLPLGGSHELTVLTASGASYAWRGLPEGPGLRLDLDLADRVMPGPENSLRLAEGVNGTATARRLAEVAGRTVLFARAGDDGWVRVERFAPGQAATRELMRLRVLPEPRSGVEVVVEPGGPLLSRPAWPWPYVAAGAAAGLLGAGIYLNVAANRDADAVNRGSANRVGDYRTHRNWAIACYALSGASGAAAVLLLFLKPQPRDRFVVLGTPVEGGGLVSLRGGF